MELMTTKVISQKNVVEGQYVLRLYCPEIARKAEPGQFVTLKINESYPLLRRPFSLHNVNREEGYLEIYYQVLGKTTEDMKKLRKDDEISILGPLGNGFKLIENGNALLIGGGLGQAPLRFLASELSLKNTKVRALLGARNDEGLKNIKCFGDYCEKVDCATEDGSVGVKGFVTEEIPGIIKNFKPDIIYTCGPIPMLKAIKEIAVENKIPCQISLEQKMACGIGVCLGCTCKGINKDKYPKVCVDGPVFWVEEVEV